MNDEIVILRQLLAARDEEVALLKEQIKKQDEVIQKQDEVIQKQNKVIQRQNKVIQKLEEKVKDLQSQIDKNSSNSSKPPSSDLKANLSSKTKQARAVRKGHSRVLLSSDFVTSSEERSIKNCPACSHVMQVTGKERVWQQVELPEVKPLVHQITLQESFCSHCKTTAMPQLKEHETYLLGPRFEGFINLMLAKHRNSHRLVRSLVEVLIPGLKISQGLISKIKRRFGRVSKAAYEELSSSILSSGSNVNSDATGWRNRGKNEHAIIIRAGPLLAYRIVPRQNGETLREIFGDKVLGTLICDRGFPAQKLLRQRTQYCLAHLLRNIQGLADHHLSSLEDSQALGEIHETIQLLFHDKHRFENGEISASTWRNYAYQKWQWIEEKFHSLLESTQADKVRRFSKKLVGQIKNFKAYLSDSKIPMTNNPAEEGLRDLVIHRKLSFGSQSNYGKLWRANTQSLADTLKNLKRNTVAFFEELIHTSRMGLAPPSIFTTP